MASHPFDGQARGVCFGQAVAKFHMGLAGFARDIDADIRARGFDGMGSHPKVSDAFRSLGIVVDQVLAFEERAAEFQRERFGATGEFDQAGAWTEEDERLLLEWLRGEAERLPERLRSQARCLIRPPQGSAEHFPIGSVGDLTYRVRQAYAEGRAWMQIPRKPEPEGEPAQPASEDAITVESESAGAKPSQPAELRPAAVQEDGNGKRHPKATVAARMIDLIKDSTTHVWTCYQFAERLGCRPSTVVATAAWKELAIARELARLQQAEQAHKKGLDVKVDKRRRPKRKKQPDSLED